MHTQFQSRMATRAPSNGAVDGPLQVNTSSPIQHIKGDIMLAVGYLESYEGMGRFDVECMSGCACEGVHNISGTHDWRTSVSVLKYFAANQHEQCRLKVTSRHDPASGGNKVKVDTLMVASAISGDPKKLWFMDIMWPEGSLMLDQGGD